MGRFNATMPRPAPSEPVNAATAPPGLVAPKLPSEGGPQLVVLPTPAPAAPAKPKPKLDFGGIKKKEAAAAPASEYPVLPDPDGVMAEHAAAFLEAHEKEEAAKGAKEAARFELVAAARPFHFTANFGKSDVPSSVAIPSPNGEVRVTFKAAYKKLDGAMLEKVEQVIGKEMAEAYLTESFVFTIKSELIPADRMQAVIDDLNELAGRHGIEAAVSVAACYTPNEEWHSARFRRLSAEDNLRLESMVDKEKGFCQVAVGPARGRK